VFSPNKSIESDFRLFAPALHASRYAVICRDKGGRSCFAYSIVRNYDYAEFN